MFEKIIVPLDGSSTAEVAFTYAGEMASRLGSDLILLFVKEPQDYRSEHILQCYLNDRLQAIEQTAAPFLKESGTKEIKVQTQIVTGDPAEEILKFTESIPGSEIIMATHGQSGVGTRWSLGSVAEKVVRATTHPVGLIRATGDKPAVRQPVRLEKILAPLDGSKESETSLPYVKEMASRLNAGVTFLHVLKFEPTIFYTPVIRERDEIITHIREYLDKQVKDCEKNGIKAKYDVAETNTEGVAEMVDKYAVKNGMDLAIMATHGYSGARKLILGSVASNLARQGSIPLLLIRSPIGA